jgi:LacI family transcriptional regulator
LQYSDGIFIPPAIPEFLENTLLQLPFPKVLINYPPPLASVDSVIWDVAHAIHQSVNHFVSMGHRRILYVGDIHTYRGFQIRWQAFREAMRAVGADPDPAHHITRSSDQIDLWIPEFKDKLISGNFSAILCSVDQDLAKIFYAVHSLGRSIPGDYSLISLENMEHPLPPKLTRPTLLIKEAGSRAAERLLWRIANPDLPYEHLRLQGDFIAGDTVTRVTLK